MKRFLVFILVIITTQSNFAQEIIKHEKRIYESEDSNLYIQKSLPLYLWMGNSLNNDSGYYLLESDTSKKYTNPFYLDVEGLNTFRSPSAVDTATLEVVHPHKQIIFEVYADSKSPYTKYLPGKSKSYWNGKKLYYGQNLKVELKTKDALSGIQKLYYSINKELYKEYSDSLIFHQEGEYILKYYAVDNVGNTERLRSKRFTIDTHSPVSVHTVHGDLFEDIVSGRSYISLKASDSVSGVSKIYYSIDDNKERIYKYRIKAYNLSEGEHKLRYYAVDFVGNKEDVKEYTFYIDKTSPILVEEMMGNSFMANGREYSSGRNKLKLTAVDNKSGIKEIYYSLNNEKYQEYEKPFYLSSVSGSLSVLSYAIDNVNNKSVSNEKSTKDKSSYVDLTGPTLKNKFDGPLFRARDSIYLSDNTKIVLKGEDKESGMNKITYSIDANQESDYSEPFVVQGKGKHTINYTGYDNVGNTNIGSLTVINDNVGPDIYTRFSILPIGKKEIDSIKYDMYSSHVVLFLSATDARVPIDRIYYSEDGENYNLYTGLVGDFKRGEIYNLKIRAADKLGNQRINEVEFAIDNTGPEIFTRFSMHPVTQLEKDSEKYNVYQSHVSIFISVTNAFVAYDKIYYSINGGSEKLYNGIVEGFMPGTDITMKIRAIDQLGSQTDKEIRFLIEE